MDDGYKEDCEDHEEIRARSGLTNIGQKIREARRRWLGHVERTTVKRKCSNINWKMVQVVDTER